MSTIEQNFEMIIEAAPGGYKEGFRADAFIRTDFDEVVLRYKFAGEDGFYNFKEFDTSTPRTFCKASAEELQTLIGKRPVFYAVSILYGADNKVSNEVEVDLS